MYNGAIVYTTVVKCTMKADGNQRTPTEIDNASTTKRRMKFQRKFNESWKSQDFDFFTLSSNLLQGSERNCNDLRCFEGLLTTLYIGCRPLGHFGKMFGHRLQARDVHSHKCPHCLVNVYHRGLIQQHIPTECNEQHGTSIRSSPSLSYSIYPPNVISSMTHPSSRHRCILTVVSYCATCLDYTHRYRIFVLPTWISLLYVPSAAF